SDMIAMVISRTPTPTVTSTPTSTFTSTFTLPPSNTLIPTPTLTSTPTTCQTFFQNKDYQNVITACAQQLKITPNDEQIYIYTGIAFRELKQPDLAITAFLKVLEINPESTEVANETSELLTDRCFTNLGRSLQNAFSDCTKAIQLKPDNARAYYWRAEVQREQGECTGAVEDIQRTIEIDPYFEDIIGTAQDQLSFLRVMQQITPEYNDIDVPTCND
ncbi:MAG TPA: tetratricopeptide repeat protein, partial [Phototrophicaceae bacterium]|nr:tetratricopeptide repeat protein [Phototrophicaceae bacterium]